MKLLISILFTVCLGLTTMAQRAVTMPLAAGDTAVDAGTSNKVLPLLTKGYAGVAIQLTLTRNSGTGAGTAALQGSNDGTNYTTIGTAYTITNVASQTTMFYVAEPVPVYLRVRISGGTTMNVTQTIKYVLRSHD